MSSILPQSTAPPNIHPAAKEARQLIYYGYLIGLILLALVFIWDLFTLLTVPPWLFGFVIGSIIGYIIYVIIGAFILVYFVKQKLLDAIDRGDYKTADDNIIIAGILALIFAAIISGILILIAKPKLDEAVKGAPGGYGAPPPPPPPPT